jgi:hypothetical protein
MGPGWSGNRSQDRVAHDRVSAGPAVTSGEDADETGIVCAGIDHLIFVR